MFFLVIFFIQSNNLTSTETETYFLSQILLLDDNNEIIRQALDVDDSFEQNLFFKISTNEDLYFDMVLINNFEQIEFQIDDLDYNKIQKIKIGKTDDDEIISKTVKLRFKDISKGVNDCYLILIRNNVDNLYHKNCISIRFSLNNSNTIIDEIPNPSYLNYTAIEGNINDDMLIFKNKLDIISNENFNDLGIQDNNVKIGEEIEYEAPVMEGLITGVDSGLTRNYNVAVVKDYIKFNTSYVFSQKIRAYGKTTISGLNPLDPYPDWTINVNGSLYKNAKYLYTIPSTSGEKGELSVRANSPYDYNPISGDEYEVYTYHRVRDYYGTLIWNTSHIRRKTY